MTTTLDSFASTPDNAADRANGGTATRDRHAESNPAIADPNAALPSLPLDMDDGAPVCRQLRASIYRADQHVKLLHLQAEVELLYRELQQRCQNQPRS